MPSDSAGPFLRLLESMSLSRRWPPAWILAVVLVAAVLPIVALETKAAVLIRVYQDAFVPLDGAWRFHWGEIPSVDFTTPLGWVYYALHAAAGRLFGFSGRILIMAPVLAWPPLAGTALVVAARRLAPIPGALFVLLCGAMTVSPEAFDGPAEALTYLADYNRLGWVTTCVVALWALTPPRTSSGWDAVEAVLLGLLTLANIYLKATFGVVAAAFILLAFFLHSDRSRWALLALTVPVVGGLLVEILVPVYQHAYLGDLLSAVRAPDSAYVVPDYRLLGKLLRDVRWNALGLSIVVAFAAALWLIGRWSGVSRLGKASASLAVLGMGLAAANETHYAWFPIPALLLFVLQSEFAVVAEAGRDRLRFRPARFALLAVPLLALFAMVGPVVWRESLSVLVARSACMNRRAIPMAGMEPSRMADLRIAVGPGRATLRQVGGGDPARTWRGGRLPGITAPGYQEILVDGLNALRAVAPPHARIETLAFSNPFPVILASPPMRGGASWWHLGRTFSERYPPPPEAILGDADVVMAPRYYFEMPTVKELERLSAPLLEKKFVLVKETDFWRVWVRRPPAGLGSAARR